MVEYFGGALDVLPYPQHGKPATVRLAPSGGGKLLAGLPSQFKVARYHSLHSNKAAQPACLRVTAETEDGCVMAVEHESLPMAAVQFHPESILTRTDLGLQLLVNAVNTLRF